MHFPVLWILCLFFTITFLFVLGSLTGTIHCDRLCYDWMALVPELDRLHVFLSESLELGCHWLVAVPESLTVLLSRFWLRNLNSEKNIDQTYVISRFEGTHNTTSLIIKLLVKGRLFWLNCTCL